MNILACYGFKIKTNLVLTLSFVFMLCFTTGIFAAGSKQSAEQMQQEIDALNLQIDFMKIKVKGASSKTASLNKKIDTKKKELQSLTSQIEQLKKSIEDTELSIKKMETEEEACNIRIKSLLVRYKARLVQFHKIKQGALLSSVVAAKDINMFLNRYQMVKYLLESDKQVIDALNKEERQRNLLALELTEKYKHLETGKKELETKEKKLNSEATGLNAMLSTLLLEKKLLVEKEKKLTSEREKLKKSLGELDSLVAKTLPVDKLAVSTSAPEKKNAKTHAESEAAASIMNFGWPIPENLRKKVGSIDEDGAHAIVIDLIADAEVSAAAKGKVLYKGSISGLGDVVILGHERGFSSVYARLDNIWVGLNETVEKGDIIGKIAAGGRNAMLHFEIRFGSKKQRPLEYLPD